jgi:hypothetical protein
MEGSLRGARIARIPTQENGARSIPNDLAHGAVFICCVSTELPSRNTTRCWLRSADFALSVRRASAKRGEDAERHQWCYRWTTTTIPGRCAGYSMMPAIGALAASTMIHNCSWRLCVTSAFCRLDSAESSEEQHPFACAMFAYLCESKSGSAPSPALSGRDKSRGATKVALGSSSVGALVVSRRCGDCASKSTGGQNCGLAGDHVHGGATHEP